MAPEGSDETGFTGDSDTQMLKPSVPSVVYIVPFAGWKGGRQRSARRNGGRKGDG